MPPDLAVAAGPTSPASSCPPAPAPVGLRRLLPAETLAAPPCPAIEALRQPGASIGGLFEARVARHPDRVALQTTEGDFTYAEVNAAANGVARLLGGLVRPAEVPIVLWLDDPLAVAAALMGIWKAGRCFVSRNPHAPRAYNASLLRRLEPAVVITDRARWATVRRAAPAATQVWAWEDMRERATTANPGTVVPPDAALRIVFTSGSTGEPKGVVHDQRCMLSEAWSAMAGAHYDEGGCHLQLSTLAHVNGSDWLFYTFMLGGTLSCYPLREWGLGRLGEWIAAKGVSRVVMVPTVFRRFVRGTTLTPGQVATVRVVHLGGEPVRPDDVRRFRRYFPGSAKLIANIGSTEGGSFARFVFAADSPLPDHRVPLGRPHPGIELELRDERGDPMGPGGAGEIVIRSHGVARGYWRDSALTAERFELPADPAAPRVFRTGDLGEWGPDGLLYSRGRRDQQIKINGHRIELAELEAVMADHPAVGAVAARAWPDPVTGARLAAYYTVAPGGVAPAAADLARWLRRHLPAPLAPRDLVRLESLPVTASGKVDRTALPPVTAAAVGPGVARDETERTLVRLFEEVFAAAPLSPETDFFAEGGDSLRAADLLAGVERELGRSLPFNALCQATTPRALVALLASEQTEFDNLVPLGRDRGEGRPPLVFVHGWSGSVTGFRGLAGRLRTRRPLVGLQGSEHCGHAARPQTVPELARHYASMLRSAYPGGPYVLAGHSAGGVLAFVVARALREMGETVAGVVVLDSRPNGLPWHRRLRMMVPYFGSRIGHHLRELVRQPGRWRYLRGRAQASVHLAKVVARPVQPGTDPYVDLLATHGLEPADVPVAVVQCAGTREDLLQGWHYLSRGRARRYEMACEHNDVFQPAHVGDLTAVMERALDDLGVSRE